MTAYSTSMRYWEGVPGDPAVKNVWGTALNTNFTLIDQSFNAVATIDITGQATYSVTTANAAPDQARQAVLPFTGALAAACVVTLPNVPRVGWATNGCTGGFTVTLTTGAGTTAVLPADGTYHLYIADGAGNVTLPSLTAAASSAITGTSLAISGGGSVSGGFIVGQNLTVVGAAQFDGAVGVNGAVGALAFNTNGPVDALSVSTFGLSVTGIGRATFGSNATNLSQLFIDPTNAGGASTVYVNTRLGNTSPFTGYICNLGVTTSFHAIWQFNGAITGSITPVGGNSTAYNTTSDATLKNDWGLLDNVGDLIDRLKPRWFTWKADPDAPPEPGFFAQEVSRVWKWAVTKGQSRKGRKDYKPWQMDNSKLIPLLVAEIQDLRRRVLDLERRP